MARADKARLTWYQVAGAKVMVITPPAPAGTTNACCQPSSRAEASRTPFRVACHPELAFWCTSR